VAAEQAAVRAGLAAEYFAALQAAVDYPGDLGSQNVAVNVEPVAAVLAAAAAAAAAAAVPVFVAVAKD
jgi:hypothetical protein